MARLSWLILVSLVAFGCGGHKPPPAPPPKASPPPPPPPPPKPKPPLLYLPAVRSVDTPRVPRAGVEEGSQRLASRIAASETFSLAPVATSSGAAPCVIESCVISAAQQAGARSVLYSRLVQYAESCVLLAVLYDAETSKNEWAFARPVACEPVAVDGAITELGGAFLGRPGKTPVGPAWAVAPIQHDITDSAFATESWAELLTTLIAASGKTIVPASTVALPLQGKKVEPYKGCPDKKCATEIGATAGAARIVSTKIARKKPTCVLSAAVFDVSTKTSSISAAAKGGCAAADVAEGLRTVATALVGEPAGGDLR